MYMPMKHDVSSSLIDATECGQLTVPGYKVTTTTYTGTTESVLCDDGYAGLRVQIRSRARVKDSGIRRNSLDAVSSRVSGLKYFCITNRSKAILLL